MNSLYDDMPSLVDPHGGGIIPAPPGANFGNDYNPFPGAPAGFGNAQGFGGAPPWAQEGGFDPFPGAQGTPHSQPAWANSNPGWVPPTFAGTPYPRSDQLPNQPPPWANSVPPPFAPPSQFPNPTHDPFASMRQSTRSVPPTDQWQLTPWNMPPTLQLPAHPMGGSAPATPWTQGMQDWPLQNTPSSGFSTLSRSRSSGGGFAPRGFVDRPSEWRRGFKVRPQGMAANIFRRMSFSGSSSADFSEGLKPNLHPYIHYRSKPPMSLDLRQGPTSVRFHALKRPANHWDVTQFACDPPLRQMRLVHEYLPWYIDVVTENPTGVTLQELLLQMHVSLMRQIRQSDFWNEEMAEDVRGDVTDAYRDRCESSGDHASGVRRVDFLRGRVIFEGLARGRHGIWEMKTSKV